jgi:ribosomal protein S18 acetylase RimI-like enzyme
MHDREVYRQVAQLHVANIDQGFLSSLGTSFLALLYEAIDTNESSVLLVARDGGRVVGFVAGTLGMLPIYRQLLRRAPRLAWALLPALLSPRKLLKIAEIVFIGKKTQTIADLPDAELLSIVVDPAERGKGHADQLYGALIAAFAQRGLSRFRIVVGTSLHTAHRFYARQGAQAVGQVEVHAGQVSVMYVHDGNAASK